MSNIYCQGHSFYTINTAERTDRNETLAQAEQSKISYPPNFEWNFGYLVNQKQTAAQRVQNHIRVPPKTKSMGTKPNVWQRIQRLICSNVHQYCRTLYQNWQNHVSANTRRIAFTVQFARAQKILLKSNLHSHQLTISPCRDYAGPPRYECCLREPKC